jgi:hypothetical protein
MTYECHPKSHVSLSECIPHEVVFPFENLLDFVECVKYFNYGFLVRFLGGGEARPVHAIYTKESGQVCGGYE